MSSKDITLICETPGDLLPEFLDLVGALRSQGLRVGVDSWRSFVPETASSHSVLLCELSGYRSKLEDFRAFLRQLEQASVQIWNPVGLLRWNLNPRYRREIHKHGCPVVPTEVILPDQKLDFESVLSSFETESLIVKSAHHVDVDSIFHVSIDDRLEELEEALAQLKGQTVLVQPYIEPWMTEGSYSLIWIDGVFSHCVFCPAEMVEVDDDDHSSNDSFGEIRKEPAPSFALKSGEKALKALAETPLYARTDFVRTSSGRYLLAKLELIEAKLFLDLEAKAVRDLAYSISKSL